MTVPATGGGDARALDHVALRGQPLAKVGQPRLHLAQLDHHLGQPHVAQLVDDEARLVDGLLDALMRVEARRAPEP